MSRATRGSARQAARRQAAEAAAPRVRPAAHGARRVEADEGLPRDAHGCVESSFRRPTPSTRHCHCDGFGSTAWRFTLTHWLISTQAHGRRSHYRDGPGPAAPARRHADPRADLRRRRHDQDGARAHDGARRHRAHHALPRAVGATRCARAGAGCTRINLMFILALQQGRDPRAIVVAELVRRDEPDQVV
jgi:hypothetical protein